MASLRVEQLQQLVESMKTYAIGVQLQEIVLTENYLFLQHYGKGSFTIAIELRPLEPRIGYYFGEIPKRKSIVKPIVLFLKAHARNLRISDISMEVELGRVVCFTYGIGEHQCALEVRLIPHGVNVIIKADGKEISLFPAKALPPSTQQVVTDPESFNIDTYLDEWMARLMNPSVKGPSSNPQQDQEKKRKKEIEKKKILLGKLEMDLQGMEKPWSSLGEYLKVHQSMDVPEEWVPLLDQSLPVNANMQRCFEKHKNQERRQEQIHERMNHIQQEINELQVPLVLGDSEVNRPVKSLASELLGKAKAKGRKLHLAEGIEAVFGKSAKDNLALLRKAQGWDLWLHLRDLPGSHLIIRRPRQKNVDHNLLLEAARWLLNETIGKKKVIEGDRYDVIVAECRYVKPIRGDRIGRVTFQNESTLTLRV